jgi:predicted transcriptional regulator YdeE
LCKLVTKEFKVVGIENKGPFQDYAEIVPQAAQHFLQSANEIPNSTGIEATVYEPPKQANQLEGTFYVGILVDEQVQPVPEGMVFKHIQHTYAVIKGKVTEMGNLYSKLDQWIVEQSYQRATPEEYIIEVYHSVEQDTEIVEVYMPIKY